MQGLATSDITNNSEVIMSTPLDFSSLTDDQLVELIREACRAAVERGNGCARAAESAYLSEAERVRIAREATDRELAARKAEEADRIARQAADAVKYDLAAEEQKRKWEKKKKISDRLNELVNSSDTLELHVWSNACGEKRVYVSVAGRKQWNDNEIEYYHTGNAKNPPKSGKLSSKLLADGHTKAEVLEFLDTVADAWTNLRLTCNL